MKFLILFRTLAISLLILFDCISDGNFDKSHNPFTFQNSFGSDGSENPSTRIDSLQSSINRPFSQNLQDNSVVQSRSKNVQDLIIDTYNKLLQDFASYYKTYIEPQVAKEPQVIIFPLPKGDNEAHQVALSTAYAAFYCKSVTNNFTEIPDAPLIQFKTFLDSKSHDMKKWGASLVYYQDPSLGFKTVKCSCEDFLKTICLKLSCQSGLCGRSKTLGAVCGHFCVQSKNDPQFDLETRVCQNDFRNTFVLGKSPLSSLNPINENIPQFSPNSAFAKNNRPNYLPQPYGDQHPPLNTYGNRNNTIPFNNFANANYNGF